jgi:hypothetical protein
MRPSRHSGEFTWTGRLPGTQGMSGEGWGSNVSWKVRLWGLGKYAGLEGTIVGVWVALGWGVGVG